MKMNTVRVFTLLVGAYFIPGCASTKYAQLKEYPQKPYDCQLDIYTVDNDIIKEYEIVCEIESKTGSTLFSNKSYKHAIELGKPIACSCGADAIIVKEVEKVDVNLLNWGEGKAVLIAIKYK